MNTQVYYSVTMNTETCCSCGIPFAIPDYLQAKLRRDGTTFYCPNGHSLSYSESEAARLRKMLEQATRKATELTEEARRARERASEEMEARHKAERDASRLKKRIQAGVCTCCNRSFQNLARHMQTKHAIPAAATPPPIKRGRGRPRKPINGAVS